MYRVLVSSTRYHVSPLAACVFRVRWSFSKTMSEKKHIQAVIVQAGRECFHGDFNGRLLHLQKATAFPTYDYGASANRCSLCRPVFCRVLWHKTSPRCKMQRVVVAFCSYFDFSSRFLQYRHVPDGKRLRKPRPSCDPSRDAMARSDTPSDRDER